LLFTGDGVGFTTTPDVDDPVDVDEPIVVDPVEPVPVEDEEDPPLTRFPLVHVCLVES